MRYAARAVDGVRSGIVALTPIQKDFSNRVPVEITRGHFTVKTISNKRELWQVYKLRYDVFHREYKNKKFPFGLDKDRFDLHADHLAIVDNRLGKIVGTYRIINSNVSTDFYSATEFNISSVFQLAGTKIELSRACIHRSYRNGVVISLLWRGIYEYLVASKAKWLFGMGSVKTTNPDEIASICKQLAADGHMNSPVNVPALTGFGIPDLQTRMERVELYNDSSTVPPLVKSYLRAGAVVGSEVAIDWDFNCTDLFLMLEVEKMASAYSRKYQIH